MLFAVDFLLNLIPRPSNIFQRYCEKNWKGLVDLMTSLDAVWYLVVLLHLLARAIVQ